MRMVERSIDEHIAGGPHDEQQHGADHREPQNPAQHDFAGAHRLGDDRVDRAVLEVRRQAHGAEKDRQQHHEIRRRRQHEVDIELARIEVAQFCRIGRWGKKPSGEQQHQAEDHQRNPHPAAHRFLHRQPSQREHPPRRKSQQIRPDRRHDPIDHVAGAHRTMPHRGNEKREHEPRYRQQPHDQQVMEHGVGEPSQIRRNCKIANHQSLVDRNTYGLRSATLSP